MKYALMLWTGPSAQPALQQVSDSPFPAFAVGHALTVSLPGRPPRARYRISAVGHAIEAQGIITSLSIEPWQAGFADADVLGGDVPSPWP